MAPPTDNTVAPIRKRCFDPVTNQQTRLLILGSLPGEKSLEQQEYYANKQNRFWMLMSAVLGQDLLTLDYQGPVAGFAGAWRRFVGMSLQKPTDKAAWIARYVTVATIICQACYQTLPQLHTIAFNGGTAAKLGLKILGEQAAQYKIMQLPSSSPAYTLAYQEKLLAWMQLQGF